MDPELRVDWIRCDGYGLCGDLAPDLIGLDEWRYPIVNEPRVPPRLRNDAQRAVDCCPMRALSLVDANAGRRGRPRTVRPDAGGGSRPGT
jgi:ferredoxin